MGPHKAATLESIRRVMTEQRHALDRIGVGSLYIFGSVARDQARPDSDVDVLVEFKGGATLARYMELKTLLESSLGRRVDLVTQKGLRGQLRAVIERDAVRVA